MNVLKEKEIFILLTHKEILVDEAPSIARRHKRTKKSKLGARVGWPRRTSRTKKHPFGSESPSRITP